MIKALKILGLFFISFTLIVGAAGDADAKKKKKQPVAKKMKFVGSVKCNGSCHDAYYEAWKTTPHGKTFDLLKPGVRADAKKKAKLDPDKDYTADPHCLRCHTTGYKQRGGFKPAGSKKKIKIKKGKNKGKIKVKNVSTKIDPEEPNLEQVGCEMCHSAAGGSEMRIMMKNTKGKFKKAENEKFGQRWDYANVCTRCHTHKNNPFNASLDPKYKFDFAEKVKQVHQVDKFWNEDNEDQKLVETKKRKKETAQSEKTPLVIEDWGFRKGRLGFKKGTMPFTRKKAVFNYKK